MAQPPSFYRPGPRIAQLPSPGNAYAPLSEGLDALSGATARAAASTEASNDQVRNLDLRTSQVERERDLQLKAGDAAAFIATEQGNLQTDLIKMREQAGPGAAGHAEQVEQRIDKFRETVTEHIGNNPDLIGRFVDNIAAVGANARVGEETWAATQRAQKSATDIGALGDALANNVRTAVTNGTATPKTLTDADDLYARAVDVLPLPGNLKDKMKRDGHVANRVAGAEGGIDVDPHAVLDQLDKGKFDDLPDQTRDALRSRARVAADRLDNSLKEGKNAAAAIARANEGNLIEDVNKGVHVDMVQLQTGLARAAASEKPEDIRLAHDLKIALAKNGVTAKYDNSTNDERLAAVHEIEGHKGWQKDEQLVASHDQLQALIGRDKHEADADPLPLYARQTGQALPPLNLNDPSAMRQRFIAGDQAAARFGKQVPAHFTEAEANDLRQQYNQATVEGKAAFIENLGAYGSERARQMMFQIAPTKPELGRLAELSATRDPALRALVREASDGSAVPVKDGVAGVVRSTMQRDFGPAMARLPGDRQRAIAQVATWIYAHRAAVSGKADTLQPDLVRSSIDAALGGTGGKGGAGKRNGSGVILPMGATQDDFDRLLAIGAAHPAAVRGAANGIPTWQGRALHSQEFLDLVPVLIHDDGVVAAYAFRSKGGSGYVKTERGQDYLLDTRSLARGLQRGSFDAQLAAHGYVRH